MRSVQPGGGWLEAVRAACGRLRRRWLRRWRPDHVARWHAARTATCDGCEHDVLDARDLLWVQNVCAVRFGAARVPCCDRFGLARLGRPELVAATALGAAFAVLAVVVTPWWTPLAVAPVAASAWFFRDPERQPPTGPGCVLAPADGVLDDVRQEEGGPFGPGRWWRLGIYLSLLDVHVQRAPVAGRVAGCEYRPGRRVPTVRRGVTDANEQLLTWIAADDTIVGVRQVAGPLARRICSVLAVGDAVAAGERFGLIKFGSRCELWLRADATWQLVVAAGMRVRAGESVLAQRTVTAAGRAPRVG